MKREHGDGNRQLARLIKRCVAEGARVEIEGLGVFQPDPKGKFHFLPETAPSVFIAYASEDLAEVRKLYAALEACGCRPWLDKRKLLPGQNWPRAIETAIRSSDYFIACFSSRSASKRGGFQSELRFALDCANRQPLDDVFLIPVRFDDCAVPHPVMRDLQYVDLFPAWEEGVERISRAIRKQEAERQRRRLPRAG